MSETLKSYESAPTGLVSVGAFVQSAADAAILSEAYDQRQNAAFGPAGAPERHSVSFENPDNPTPEDLRKLAEHPVCEHFELHQGRIQPKYSPIRDLVKDPAGRTDYGWDDIKRRTHLRSAHARGWREFPWLNRPHDGVAIIVGGGPSLKKMLPVLRKLARKPKHFIITTNKTHDFLLNLPKLGLGQAIKPWAAFLLDPCDWVKDYIKPIPGVQYLIGDQCSPETFAVFEKDGITRWILRTTNPKKDNDIVPQHMRPVFGGSTGGARCRTVMYYNGFRKILYFGFDSSCDEIGNLHGYEKWDSVKDRLSVKIIDEDGFERAFITNSHMARQAQEFIEMRDEWIKAYREGKADWVDEIFYGDGLLPTIAARFGLHADPKRNVVKDATLCRAHQKDYAHAG